MIQFINVSKVYGNKVVALRDINIKIEKGEFLFWWDPAAPVNPPLSAYCSG